MWMTDLLLGTEELEDKVCVSQFPNKNLQGFDDFVPWNLIDLRISLDSLNLLARRSLGFNDLCDRKSRQLASNEKYSRF